MKKPEYILIRVGEQALKSEYVQKRFFRILLNNIHSGLKGISYSLKTERNRILINTKQIKKTLNILRRVFGITSISPVWVCKSELKDISLLSAKIAKYLKLNKKKTFAIRARRTGSHDFTSQDIGKQAGHAINVETGSRVDLTKPDKEIFVDCRQKEAYIYIEKIPGPGGLPLGTAGKILSILYDKESALATWLMMKRGAEIIVFPKKKTKFLSILKKWHIGKRLKIVKSLKKEDIQAIVTTNYNVSSKIKDKNLLILQPLVGFTREKIKEYCNKFTHLNE